MGFWSSGIRIMHDGNFVSEFYCPRHSDLNVMRQPAWFRFVHSVSGSTVLVAVSGFSWAMTQWAPFSLVRNISTFSVVYVVEASMLKLISWARKSLLLPMMTYSTKPCLFDLRTPEVVYLPRDGRGTERSYGMRMKTMPIETLTKHTVSSETEDEYQLRLLTIDMTADAKTLEKRSMFLSLRLGRLLLKGHAHLMLC